MRNTLSNIGCLVTVALAALGIYSLVSSPESQSQPVIPLVETYTPGPYPTLAVTPPFNVPVSSPEATWTPGARPIEGSTKTPDPFHDRKQHFVDGSATEPKPAQTELASNSHAPERR